MKKYLFLGKKLFPLCRSLTGRDTLKTLKILRSELPKLKIKKIKSGTKVFDWKVPEEWNIKDAYIKDKNNKKIIDFKKNNLHIFSYSKNINLILTKNQLLKKVYSLPHLPNAIPYVTSYYKRNWGFCETYRRKMKIKKKYSKRDKFKVFIQSSFNKKGNMHYGEMIIKGKNKKEILLSTYICHPSMANNEISGILVAVALSNFFLKRKKIPYYTIRVLFIPETIGAIAYINKNLKALKKRVIGGYVLSCIGDNRNFSYLNSKYGNSFSDLCAKETFKKLKIKYKNYSFLSRGSDERQFNSPGIDIPIGSIMRTKYGEYPEYHTSLDNFNLVTEKGLRGGFHIAKKILENMQTKRNLSIYYRKTKKRHQKNPISLVKCEPHLSKRNLYHFINLNKKNLFRKYLDFLQYSDGTNNINNISKIIKISLNETLKIQKILKNKNLIK